MKKYLSLFRLFLLVHVAIAVPMQLKYPAKWDLEAPGFDDLQLLVRVMDSPEPSQDPTPDEPLDEEGVEKAYEELDFDPNGRGKIGQLFANPTQILTVTEIRDEAHERTRECYPDHKRHNDEADAFRHAYFNCRLSSIIGEKDTKEWADAHERSNVNPDGERLMDLQNNEVGRDISKCLKDPTPDECEKAIKQAILDGKLTLKPVPVDTSGNDDGDSGYGSNESID